MSIRHNKFLRLLFLSILTISGCEKSFITGITGTVEITKGDCMPVIDYEGREYDKYNGTIFFVVKDDWDNLENDGYEQLRNNSISIQVKRGKLSTELPVNIYYVMPEEVYEYSDRNTISIVSKEVLKEDFKFIICTSF